MGWEALHTDIEKLVAIDKGNDWHAPRAVADRAIAAMQKYEVDGYPPPRFWPFEGTDLILVWRVERWTIYHHFCEDGNDYIDTDYRQSMAHRQCKEKLMGEVK